MISLLQEAPVQHCDKENSMEYILEEDASLLEAMNACPAPQTQDSAHQATEIANKNDVDGESLDDRLARFRYGAPVILFLLLIHEDIATCFAAVLILFRVYYSLLLAAS